MKQTSTLTKILFAHARKQASAERINLFFKAALAANMILFAVLQMAFGQTGYIYIHTKSLSQDINQSFNFSVNTISGNTVSSFTLEDQAINIEPTDIGAGHGSGGGELWVVAGGTLGGNGPIYHRSANSTVWKMVPSGSGSAIDGADFGHFVVCNTSGDAYAYNGSSFIRIYDHAVYGANAVDIANSGSITAGVGLTAIVDNNGQVWKYTGNYSTTTTWTKITPTDKSGFTFTRLDINPSTNDIVLTDANGSVSKINPSGTGLVYYGRTAAAPSVKYGDVAVDNNGTMYSVQQDGQGMDAVYRYNGTSWIEEPETGLHYLLTCGDAGQVWVIKGLTAAQSTSFANPSTIYTRTGDGSGTWLDDERVQTTQNDNSIMIPVVPGTYTISQSSVSNWNLQGIIIYDSASGSTTSVASNSASVVVAAGQVVHVLFTNGLVDPTQVPSGCGVNAIIQNFGSGAVGTHGSPLTGLTDFHYYNNSNSNQTPDGYYSLSQNSSQWNNGSLTDHTGISGGYFMIINASYAPNQFYKHRITGLIPGIKYVLSFWAANLSPGTPLLPNILAGITDTASGAVIGSTSTGNLPTDNNWHQYKFSFTATVTTGDLFLQNNAQGGFGNDLAIDDIGFSSDVCSTLPVTLMNFDAQKQNNKSVLLDWSTTSQIDFNYFQIERSGDGVTWDGIGMMLGQENTSTDQHYTFTDELPFNGLNYYRLKMVDMNGAISYSEVKTADFFNSEWSVSMYPNPVATGGIVRIQSSEPLQNIRVFDVNGKLVLVQNSSAIETQGNTCYTLNTNSLAQGIYFIQMLNSNGKTETFKLVRKN